MSNDLHDDFGEEGLLVPDLTLVWWSRERKKRKGQSMKRRKGDWRKARRREGERNAEKGENLKTRGEEKVEDKAEKSRGNEKQKRMLLCGRLSGIEPDQFVVSGHPPLCVPTTILFRTIISGVAYPGCFQRLIALSLYITLSDKHILYQL